MYYLNVSKKNRVMINRSKYISNFLLKTTKYNIMYQFNEKLQHQGHQQPKFIPPKYVIPL